MTLPRAYEDQLVERAKSDADAFGELYDHYFGQIYRFAYSRTRDQDAAEEVTQEVFMKALRAMPRYRPSGHPFSSWLYQISANAIADHFRQRRPQASLDAAIEIVDPARPGGGAGGPIRRGGAGLGRDRQPAGAAAHRHDPETR